MNAVAPATRSGATRAVLAALVGAAAALGADHALVVTQVAENWSRDVRVATLAPALAPTRDVAVVAIDEETLSALAYRSPIDRALLADLVTSLAAKGVRAIGIDLLLDGPSEPAKDAALRSVLERSTVPVVVAWAGRSDGLTERQTAWQDAYLAGLDRGSARVLDDPADAVVRAVPLAPRAAAEPRGFAAVLGARAGIQVPDRATLTLDFRAGTGRDGRYIPVYPAHAVVLLPRPWLEGRVVLIGVDVALADRHRTPRSVLGAGETAGVIVHAQALAQLADGRELEIASRGLRLGLVWAAALAGAAIATIPAAGPVIALVTLAGLVALWLGGFAAFRVGAPLVPLVAPSIALGLAAGAASAARQRAERAARQFVQRAFSKYLAPEMVARLVANPGALSVGGERRTVTFVFTDVADFTTLVENMDPGPLVTLLNEYLDGACRIAMGSGGTIDKIVGDALHVMFNAPADQEDHRQRALGCAVALDAFSRSFVARQREQGIAFGMTRIGVNTGPVVVGNFGGAERFDYTAHGDAINTAARLEGANKHLGTRILASASSVAPVEGIECRPVGTLVLKGKRRGIEVLEPRLAAGEESAPLDEYLAAHALLERADPDAAAAFSRLASRHPDDSLVALHARRLARGEAGTVITLAEK